MATERPKCICRALQRRIVEGEAGVTWEYFHCTTEAERQEVDQWLVEIQHPLAFRAGTAESRFRAIVAELHAAISA